MRDRMIWLAGCALLVGCDGMDKPAGNDVANNDVAGNGVAVASPTGPPDTRITDGWIGRWIGVEGLALDVAAGDAPGRYMLHIALMDGAGDHAGHADGATIRFTRDGVAETLRHTDGAETGLKWLADKKDCLTIKPGEGFCRD